MSDATDTVSEEAQPAVDAKRQPLLDALRGELGDAILGSEIANDDIWVRVDRTAWRRAFTFCRKNLGLEYFCFISGIDWMPAPDLSGEKAFEPAEGVAVGNDAVHDIVDDDAGGEPAEPEEAPITATADGRFVTGVAGGDTRFQVFGRLYSVTDHVGITLKADLDDGNPTIDSVHDIYAGADWHERELWEMYGVDVTGHPSLRHLYLPGEFEGYPLRKDFPLLAREVKPWPGLVDVEPLPGEAPEAAGESTEGEG